MLEIDAHSAAGYLRGTGRIAAREQVSVRELSGGVSNMVLLVEREMTIDSSPLPLRFVLKQARGRLRVEQPWFCDVERNWREVQVLSACQRAIAAESEGAVLIETPRVLFTDAPNYLFAMTAAPAGHTTWKERLLAGNADATIAAACGRTLGRLHAATWADPELARRLGDRSLFDALRIDPYFRAVAERDDALRPHFERLIESVADHPRCLVHADFSPKNLLVWDQAGETNMMLIDFETGHFGDPAFDLGFFATHLVLKRFYHAPHKEQFARLVDAFWREYRPIVESRAGAAQTADLAHRAARNLGGCLLARLEGKSPVEYLTDPGKRADARALAVRLLTAEEAVFPDSIEDSL
jgi:5-methylthioribose kinase